MDRSQYLVAALQNMGQPQAQPQPQGLSIGQMQGIAKQRSAFEAQNPGQNFMAHGIRQMGSNVMAAPGNVASNLAGLFSLGRGA
jgi:hypothetical protein